MIVGAAICILFTLVSMLLGKLLTGGTLDSAVKNFPLTILPIFAQVIIPLIGAMAVCDLFASEYHDMSIKALLIRPITRFKIYTAKVCASFTMCVIMFAAAFAVSILCNIISVGKTDGAGYAFFAYLIDLVPVLIIILMSALINQCTKSSTSSMFLCIIVYVVLKAGGIFKPVLDSLLFTGYMQWHRLWLGIPLPPSMLIAKCILLLGYGVTFFCGGYCMFLKREF